MDCEWTLPSGPSFSIEQVGMNKMYTAPSQLKSDKEAVARATSLKDEAAARDQALSTAETAEFEGTRPLRK